MNKIRTTENAEVEPVSNVTEYTTQTTEQKIKHKQFWVEVNIQDPAQNAGWKFHRAWPTDFEMLHSAGIKTVRVVEYSAYEQLKAKLEKAKEALEFYINESEPVFHEYVGEYPSGGYMRVIGDWETAREALKEIEE